MVVKVLLTTKYALSLMHSAGEANIHSIYRKTVNFLSDGRLVSLHPKSTPLSPIGMLTDLNEAEFSSLDFSYNDHVSISENGILIGNRYFTLQGAELIGSEIQPVGAERELKLRGMISDALRQLFLQNTTFCDLLLGGNEYLTSPVALYAHNILSRSKEQLDNSEPESAANYLTQLIGLGVGLTPSGDDFLCGVLAALAMRGNSSKLLSALKARIKQKLSYTNDISGELLRCACEGHFSLPILNLPNEKSAEKIAGSFSKIGHSSGADTLNGILFVFSQIERRANHANIVI